MNNKGLIFVHDTAGNKRFLYVSNNACPDGAGEQLVKFMCYSNFSNHPTVDSIIETLEYTYIPIEDYHKLDVEWKYDIFIYNDRLVLTGSSQENGTEFTFERALRH